MFCVFANFCNVRLVPEIRLVEEKWPKEIIGSSMFTRAKQRHFYWFLSVRGTRACLRPSISDETFCGIFINSVQCFTKCCPSSFLKIGSLSHTQLNNVPVFPIFLHRFGSYLMRKISMECSVNVIFVKIGTRKTVFSV